MYADSNFYRLGKRHWIKSAPIRENADQNNSEYEQFLRSEILWKKEITCANCFQVDNYFYGTDNVLNNMM